MRERTHIAIGTVAAAALAPWLRWGAVPFWLGASLTDADLYAYYVVRHRHLDPRRAVRYYHTLAGRRERARKLLHSPLAPAVALACARVWPGCAAFGAGVALHQLLDWYGGRPYRGMRRAIERRSAGACEVCGRREAALDLMEPRYSGPHADDGHDPASWQLLCRRCNEAT